MHRFGLVRASFIPDDIFQRMRLLSRHRTNLVSDLSRVKNRVQKILEDGNIKLGIIASDVFGKSGLQVLRALADGVTDASLLAKQITTRLKRRSEARKALTNCFNHQHCFLIRELVEQYDFINDKIIVTENELLELAGPYHHLLKKLPDSMMFWLWAYLQKQLIKWTALKMQDLLLLGLELLPVITSLQAKKKDQNVGKVIRT